MSCQQFDFTLGSCLVEITAEIGDSKRPAYNVYVFLVEKNGSVIRPLVRSDGHRVKIRAGSVPVALTSAVSFLRARLGEVKDAGHTPELGTATVGRPIPLG